MQNRYDTLETLLYAQPEEQRVRLTPENRDFYRYQAGVLKSLLDHTDVERDYSEMYHDGIKALLSGNMDDYIEAYSELRRACQSFTGDAEAVEFKYSHANSSRQAYTELSHSGQTSPEQENYFAYTQPEPAALWPDRRVDVFGFYDHGDEHGRAVTIKENKGPIRRLVSRLGRLALGRRS